MKILSYIVRRDSGFAPNPFWGCCTLACCKPVVRRTAEVGDLVVGLTPKAAGHRVVYVMRVTKKMTFAEYWNARAFQKKKPDCQGSERYLVGDNIYRPLANGKFEQQKSRHTAKDKRKDLSGKFVWASSDFVYFGAEAIELPMGGPSWIAAVRPLQTSSIKRQTLPTWILMMVLLVSFIVLPAQVAEEKEKQLLLGWMQTPVRENEWLVSKLAYGIVLMLTSVVALQWMGRESSCAHGVSYLAMLCAGGFCFGALGICLGLLCRNQASARTLGVLCYLPLLLPAALSDMSQELRSVAPLVPSYRFYEPIRAMLLEDSGLEAFTHAWISLVAIGLLACLASHRLIKKRWLM